MRRRNRRRIGLITGAVALCLALAAGISFAAMAGQADAAGQAVAGKTATGADGGDGSAKAIGGGYAVTGQLSGVGTMTKLYDVSDGLPTSEANCILGASDGYVWIGAYSGIIRYDGVEFERFPASEGLTNGRGLFEDHKGRIWVGTNDNGVVVLDGNKTTHITRDDGLPSSSIRTFAEDGEGNVFIGTTAGLAYADRGLEVHRVEEERLSNETISRLVTDASGKIYGHTKEGILFSVDAGKIDAFYTSQELGMESVTAILADPRKAGQVYLGTDSSHLYRGRFGDKAARMQKISIAPAHHANWLSYDCNRIWVAADVGVGYLDERFNFHKLENIPLDNSTEMVTSDYQGNMWFASSRQGVMKLIANNFQNYTANAGIPDQVVNATCLYHGDVYVGTDLGLHVIGQDGQEKKNRLTRYIGDARIRCLLTDKAGNLWVSTYTGGLGLVCMSADGNIVSFTTKEGMPSDEVRCTAETSDGSVIVGTNGGLAVIKSGKVIRKVGAEEGLHNPFILTVCEGDKGEIYAGSDGDGMYRIKGTKVKQVGAGDGLTSDVIMRIRKDSDRGLYWIITSNSIQYMKDGTIQNVKSFPYNNNFDLYPASDGTLWVMSSQGLYTVKAEDMLKDDVKDYRLYTLANGLTSLPVAHGYNAVDKAGNLYVAGQSGVSKVNINHYLEESHRIRTAVRSVYLDDTEIFPDKEGNYIIPARRGRIQITPAALDYTVTNPTIHAFLEGAEDPGITAEQSNLDTLEYTGLSYGKYVLHIQIMDRGTGEMLSDETFNFDKKPRFFELTIVRVLLILLLAAAVGLIVWRFMTGTVIRRQYAQIEEAKAEAERASTAKSRFLANMSHEIRTPISTIMGMDELILREDVKDVPKAYYGPVVERARQIKRSAETLLALVNDLLDISKIESGKMNLVEYEYSTETMLREVIAPIRMSSEEKDLSFEVDVDKALPRRLYGDAGKIKQIVSNLLTNAVKYTEVGGFVLRVEVTGKEDDACNLRISVKDTGMGIKEEELNKLFSAYERLDEEKNRNILGTGLGLDISRQFTELLGGTLWCESTYGEGSEFILELKQKIVEKKGIGMFAEEETEEEGGRYVPLFRAPDADILVVDDDPMNLTMVKELLAPTRVFVTTALSGQDALEKLRYGTFNVVFLDHMMPEMDGIETVERIRKTHPELPVYALTANTTAGGEAFYKSKGFTGYLTKPIDTVAMERVIMRHLPEEIVMISEEEGK